MSKDYIKLNKEQIDRINHFCNSLMVCSYTNQETVEYHKEWLDHIIQKGKELDNMEDDLINNRKQR